MARIAGVELPNNAKVDYALTLIYGVGWSRARDIFSTTNIDNSKRIKDLTDEELAQITKRLEEYVVEGDLRRRIREDIQRYIAINSYKGSRHARGLPVRGQRTKTNARTKKGKRKTVGAFKKEALTAKQQQVKAAPKATK